MMNGTWMRKLRDVGMYAAALLLWSAQAAPAQHWLHPDSAGRTNQSIFRAIEDWPAPNELRTGSGAPGARYWQQKVDYEIRTELDTVAHRVSGTERITYHNNSPDALDYLWIQLDQNVRSLEHSRTYQMRAALPEEIDPRARRWLGVDLFDGGHEIARGCLIL